MNREILLGLLVCSQLGLFAQLMPNANDRPQVYDAFSGSALYLHSAYNYFQREQTGPDGETKIIFGYSEPGERSPIQVSESNDSTTVYIRIGRVEDYRNYRFNLFQVTADKKRERQVICGYKKGISWVYEPEAKQVPIRVKLVKEKLITIAFLSDELGEYALFFGPMDNGIPKYKMFTFGTRAAGSRNQEFD